MRHIFHNWLKIGDLELIEPAGEDVGDKILSYCGEQKWINFHLIFF
jgi:hypothetical protein